jgi:hypothetical protein
MRHPLRMRAAVSAALALAASLGAAHPADAADQPSGDPMYEDAHVAALYDAVAGADDPRAAYAALAMADKAALDDHYLPSDTVERVRLVPQDPDAQAAVDSRLVETHYSSAEAASSALAAVRGCWGGYVVASTHARAGNVVYDTFTEGRWCHDGGGVTSAVFDRSWSEPHMVGWRDDGQVGAGSGVSGGMAKIWSQRRMTLGAGGWDIKSVQPCTRLVGSASGDRHGDAVCSIYG